MLNWPRRTASWTRYIIGAGAVIALTAVGSAAMWSTRLPSRPIQWNDLNGRLNLGSAGAATSSERPIIVNRWPNAGALGGSLDRGGELAYGGGNAAGKFADGKNNGKGKDRENGALWGSRARSGLTATAGNRGYGFGGGKGGGGGLGSGATVANTGKGRSASPSPKAQKASNNNSSRSNGGSRSSGGGGSAPRSEGSTTVGDLASGAAGGATGTGLDLGWSGGGSAAGPGSMAATPEPSSMLLIGTGVLGVAGMLRRRRRS